MCDASAAIGCARSKSAFHHPIDYELDFNTLKFESAANIDMHTRHTVYLVLNLLKMNSCAKILQRE